MVFYIFSMIILSLLGTRVWACAACGFGDDGSRWGYLVTTALMTFFPLLLFAVTVYLIRKHIKKNQADSAAADS